MGGGVEDGGRVEVPKNGGGGGWEALALVDPGGDVGGLVKRLALIPYSHRNEKSDLMYYYVVKRNSFAFLSHQRGVRGEQHG